MSIHQPPDDREHSTDAHNAVTSRIAERFRKRGRARTAPPATHHPRAVLKKFMARCFTALAASGWLIFGGQVASSYLSEPFDNMAAQQSRSLTAGEAVMAQALFGADFETDSIRLRFHDKAPEHIFNRLRGSAERRPLAYVNGGDTRNMHFIDRNFHALDYSRADDMGLRGGVFMHELAHIWQHRIGSVSQHCGIYDYTLTAESRFEDFCSEQQAEIIRSYTMRFIIPNHPLMRVEAYFHGVAYSMGENIAFNMDDTDRNLARVVESALPHAAAARLRVQAGFNRAAQCSIDRMHEAPGTGFQDHFNACADTYAGTLNRESLTRDVIVQDTFDESTPVPPPLPARAPRPST